ncbi:MAG: TRAP transporter TatT component family protein [Pseudomonadota bacterium]
MLFASVLVSGCASLVSSFTSDFAEDLGNSILDNPDVEMVQEGAPAFLLLVDSLVAQSPNNATLLMQSARLSSAYAAAFVDDPDRAKLMNAKALKDMEQAVCVSMKDACDLRTRPYDEFEVWLAARGVDEVPELYQLASVWTGWIQANSDDFVAIAELGRVKALVLRVTDLDESYDFGGAHLYLGVFETLLPPSLGGRPEVGRSHFEKAIALSDGKYLMTKVMFADQYARLLFDRELHDQLLEDVLAADPAVPGLTLINTVAQRRAQDLLDSADAYF